MKKLAIALSVFIFLSCAKDEKLNPGSEETPTIWSTQFYNELRTESELVFQNIDNNEERVILKVETIEEGFVSEPCSDNQLDENGNCPSFATSRHHLKIDSTINQSNLPDDFGFSLLMFENSGSLKGIMLIDSKGLGLVTYLDLHTLSPKNLSTDMDYKFEILATDTGTETVVTSTYLPLSEEGKPVYLVYSLERGILEMAVNIRTIENNVSVKTYNRYQRLFNN